MGVVCGSGASLHASEAVLKVESLAVEAAHLDQGSVHLLLLLVWDCNMLPIPTVLATAILNQRTNKRNADVVMNDAKVKDAEENGDIEEEDEDGSEDEDDSGNSKGEDSEDIAEDDEEDYGNVNGEERSDDKDDDDDDEDYDDEDCYDEEDKDGDQPFQKR